MPNGYLGFRTAVAIAASVAGARFLTGTLPRLRFCLDLSKASSYCPSTIAKAMFFQLAVVYG